MRTTYIAYMAIEALLVIFALELAVGGRNCLFLDGEITSSALFNIREGTFISKHS